MTNVVTIIIIANSWTSKPNAITMQVSSNSRKSVQIKFGERDPSCLFRARPTMGNELNNSAYKLTPSKVGVQPNGNDLPATQP